MVALFFYLDPRERIVKETLSFYPIDESVQYEAANSSLKLLVIEDEDEYTLEWTTHSALDKAVYLRHDFSLLFEDGKLKEKMSQLEEEKKDIEMSMRVNASDSGHFEVISFHHSEIHYPNDQIKSKHIITKDELYVIDSPLAPFHAFKKAQTNDETKGKKVLDNIVKQQLSFVWKDLLIHYKINKNDYTIFPITALENISKDGIPNLTKTQNEKITSMIIENIYLHYFFGIPKGDGGQISPIGSYIPIVLVPKNDPDHFMILFRTEDDKNVQLIKKILN